MDSVERKKIIFWMVLLLPLVGWFGTAKKLDMIRKGHDSPRIVVGIRHRLDDCALFASRGFVLDQDVPILAVDRVGSGA